VRDLYLQRRENDVVMATFGNGFWILDDYSPLREVSAMTMAQEARMLPSRGAYQFQTWGITDPGSAGIATLGGNFAMPNPPYGAPLTYHVRTAMPQGTSLVADITDNSGRRVRRLTLNGNPGLYRTMWNLTGDPEPQPQPQPQGQQGQQGPPGRGGGAAGGQGGGRGGGAGGGQGGGGFGGRGGGGGGTAVQPGRFTVQLGKLTGETFTAVGPAQSFRVVTLPEKNYQLYR
jgi:hypothetical protein